MDFLKPIHQLGSRSCICEQLAGFVDLRLEVPGLLADELVSGGSELRLQLIRIGHPCRGNCPMKDRPNEV